jgi:quercetin dioxygenase-like cupin family protein
MLKWRENPSTTLRMLALSAVAAAASLAAGDLDADGRRPDAKVTSLMRRPLEGLPGKEGVLARVEYPAGYVGAEHRHPGPLFVYVLSGSVEMQMSGGQRRTLETGDTFYEDPRHDHGVGRNVSSTEPAELLVFAIKDPNAPLVLPPRR